MASIDFDKMSKQDLIDFRRKALKARERPSVENNYFTTKFKAGLSNKQPTDWVPTELFKDWCEHHGPSNHLTAECRDGNGTKKKPLKQQKPKVDYQAILRVEREVSGPCHHQWAPVS